MSTPTPAGRARDVDALARRGPPDHARTRPLTGSPIVVEQAHGRVRRLAVHLPARRQRLCCDLTQQQIAPFSQWGIEYALVPFKPRIADRHAAPWRENVPWMFVGAADGTVLTYDPAQPPGAPSTLAAGEVVDLHHRRARHREEPGLEAPVLRRRAT